MRILFLTLVIILTVSSTVSSSLYQIAAKNYTSLSVIFSESLHSSCLQMTASSITLSDPNGLLDFDQTNTSIAKFENMETLNRNTSEDDICNINFQFLTAKNTLNQNRNLIELKANSLTQNRWLDGMGNHVGDLKNCTLEKSTSSPVQYATLPEPATLSILGLGFISMVFYKWPN